MFVIIIYLYFRLSLFPIGFVNNFSYVIWTGNIRYQRVFIGELVRINALVIPRLFAGYATRYAKCLRRYAIFG
jgi:hypothetical protein